MRIAIIIIFIFFTVLDLNAQTSDWQVDVSRSEMDDSPVITLGLLSNNSIKGWLRSFTPMLVVRCKENKTELFVMTGMPANIESDDLEKHTVRIRLDGDSPLIQKWSSSTDKKALFAPEPILMAKRIAGSVIMLFEFIPYNSNPQIARFSVAGLDRNLGKVSKACNWRY